MDSLEKIGKIYAILLCKFFVNYDIIIPKGYNTDMGGPIMYQCGDKVLYGAHGICTILETEVRKIDRKNVEYYVLVPVDQPAARFYIPMHNKVALAKLRPMLTPDQLNALLQSHVQCDLKWIDEENQRKQRYKELITSGDRDALIDMIHLLHIHKKNQLDAGKKFHQCDENFLRDALKLINTEFSLVLNIPADEVEAYILKMMRI